MPDSSLGSLNFDLGASVDDLVKSFQAMTEMMNKLGTTLAGTEYPGPYLIQEEPG